jgi:hypothetical protein
LKRRSGLRHFKRITEMKTGDTDLQVFEKTLLAIKGLEVELADFRREMQELKTSMAERMKTVESKTLLCQTNPATCSTARRLEEHIAHDNGRTGKIAGIMGCISGTGGFLFALLTSLFGGKR